MNKNVNLKTIRLEGENFIGNYYNKKPYGLWELKDKSIKHCFLYDENRYYKKDEYYIVDNKFYYIKYDYVNYNYIVEDKKNKKMYIIKNNNKDIINDNNSNQKYILKPMYKFIYIETESDRKTLPDFIFDEEWDWKNENVEIDIKIIK